MSTQPAQASGVAVEDRFLFDLQGYLLLRQALDAPTVARLLAEVRRLETLPHDDSHWRRPQPDGAESQPTRQERPGFLRLNGLLRLSPVFDELIDHPRVLPYLREFMRGPQLANTWSISKTAGHEVGSWHRGIGPEGYSFRQGVISTRMLNVVFFLTENTPENGCMLALPGGHKSNFDLNWRDYPDQTLPGTRQILGQPGDVLLFSEALLHNGLGSVCAQPRTNLYFNYVARDFNIMTYSPQHNYHFAMPAHVRARFTPAQQALTQWMQYVQAID